MDVGVKSEVVQILDEEVLSPGKLEYPGRMTEGSEVWSCTEVLSPGKLGDPEWMTERSEKRSWRDIRQGSVDPEKLWNPGVKREVVQMSYEEVVPQGSFKDPGVDDWRERRVKLREVRENRRSELEWRVSVVSESGERSAEWSWGWVDLVDVCKESTVKFRIQCGGEHVQKSVTSLRRRTKHSIIYFFSFLQ